MRSPGPRSLARLGPLVVAIAVAGCAGEPGAASGASDAASPTPAAPSLQFAFQGDAPVVTRGLTGIDELYINPGAVIDDGEQLHMFANVFSAWPGRVLVPHLVSVDGTSWTLASDEPALDSDSVPFAGGGADVSTGFIADDGTWVLIFETVELTEPWVLGRATAPGPDGPWTIEPEPMLTAGAEGSWDAGGLSWPSVVRTDDGYRLYYTALDQPRGSAVIGMATSADGRTWEKHPDPVLRPEQEWERGGVDRPRVASTPDGLVMVYAGGRLTDRGLAWSDDGVTWRRDGDEPVITRDDFPINASAWDAALIVRDGALHYYLEIGLASGNAGTDVFLATAPLP